LDPAPTACFYYLKHISKFSQFSNWKWITAYYLTNPPLWFSRFQADCLIFEIHLFCNYRLISISVFNCPLSKYFTCFSFPSHWFSSCSSELEKNCCCRHSSWWWKQIRCPSCFIAGNFHVFDSYHFHFDDSIIS
jgi:hypothetical protein